MADFGFHHPLDYIEDALEFLELSNFVMWPDPGGWADQDANLIADMKTYRRVYAREAWEVEHGIESGVYEEQQRHTEARLGDFD